MLALLLLAFPAPAPSLPQTAPQPALEAVVVGRQRQRVTYFGTNPKQPSPGQVTFEWGRLKYDEAQAEDGRWPAGLDYWSTLDVNCNLAFGGKPVRPGHYYVLADRKGDGMKLVLLPSKTLRKKQVGFADAAATKGGIAIPLTPEKVEGAARDLSMILNFVDRKSAPEKLKFKLAWGDKAYTAEVKLKSLGQVQPFMQAEKRSRAILRAPRDADSGRCPTVVVEHALPKWNPARDTAMKGLEPGARWRLGQNFWSSLETNVPITIAGAKVAPEYYFLMLERGEGDAWSLVLLDNDAARKKTMDAFQAATTKDGMRVPLRREAPLKEPQAELALTMETGEAAGGATLHLRWGPHHLTAPVQVQLPKQ